AQASELERIPASSYHVFEPLVRDPGVPVQLRKAHRDIFFYTWGDFACCLPPGAAAETLVDAWVPETGAAAKAGTGDGPPGTQRALHLAVDDVLILEE